MTNDTVNPYEAATFLTEGRATSWELTLPTEAPAGSDDLPRAVATAKPGEALVLTPLRVGNAALFALSPGGLEAGLTPGKLHAFVHGERPWRQYLAFGLRREELPPPGATFTRRFLLTLDDGSDGALERARAFARDYGLTGPRDHGTTGPRDHRSGIRGQWSWGQWSVVRGLGLRLTAVEGGFQGTLRDLPAPNPLPVTVEGLEQNWPAGVFQEEKATVRRIGVTEGVGYVALEKTEEGPLFIGNLLTCEDPEVRLELLALDAAKQGPVFVAHNPTDRDKQVTVRSPVPTRAMRRLAVPLSLRAGSSVRWPEE